MDVQRFERVHEIRRLRPVSLFVSSVIFGTEHTFDLSLGMRKGRPLRDAPCEPSLSDYSPVNHPAKRTSPSPSAMPAAK